jgi:hypothetical protein
MKDEHPHSGAAYRIVEQPDQSFGVEVTIPGTHPTTVTGFATEAAAAEWAAKHKEGVEKGETFRRRPTFRKRQASS